MPRDAILSSLRYLVYALVIAVPLFYFPMGMYPFQVGKTVVFQGIIEIIVALYAALALFHKEYRPKFTFLSWSVVALVAAGFLSAFAGVDWRLSLFSDEQRTLGLIGVLHVALLFLVLSSLRKEIPWEAVFKVSVYTAAFTALVGITQTFLVFPRATSSQWLYILFEQASTRVGSTFNNPAFFAGYLLFNFFLAVWLTLKAFWDRISGWERVTLGASSALILVAIFLAQTLGVLLGLSVGVVFLLGWFYFDRNSASLKRISAIIFLALVLIGAAFWFTRTNALWRQVPGFARVSTFSFENLSVSTRLLTWKIALRGFEDRPILGWGFENFRIAYNRHYDPEMLSLGVSGTYWDKPHNILLEYLVTTGLVGFLAYLSLWVALLVTLWKLRQQALFFEVPIFAAMLIAYFVQNLFVFDTIGTYLMFGLVLAFVGGRMMPSDDIPASSEERLFGLSLRRVSFIFLALSLLPLYWNVAIVNANRLEYQGVNFLLNQLPESSLVAFSAALEQPTPYRDDIRKNFASTVSQAYQQGIEYPRLEQLHRRLVGELKAVIRNHPQDFFNYLSLAQFQNVFRAFDPSYAEEAEQMARRALELSPRRQQVYYVLASANIAKGDVKSAYKIFEDVVALNPDAGDPHFLYGLTAYGAGDVDIGKREIARAADLGRFPRSAGEAMALGNFAADLEEDYERAIAYYNQAMRFTEILVGETQERTRMQIILKLGVASYYAGHKEAALDYFTRLHQLIDIASLPIYPQLKPILDEVGFTQ